MTVDGKVLSSGIDVTELADAPALESVGTTATFDGMMNSRLELLLLVFSLPVGTGKTGSEVVMPPSAVVDEGGVEASAVPSLELLVLALIEDAEIGSVASAAAFPLPLGRSGVSDCFDSIPGITVPDELLGEDDGSELDEASVGCAVTSIDDSVTDVTELVASLWEVTGGGASALAVSINRKLVVVVAGPSEFEDVVSGLPSCVVAPAEAAEGSGNSPSPNPATVIAVHHIESSAL